MGQELTIGRAYSNLLRLEGEEISRVHAIVYRRGTDYILRDLDSKNGVFLNGQKIGNAMLGAADEIQVGKYTMLFDPPGDYNLKAFLRKHHVDVEDDAEAVSPAGVEDTSSAHDHSVSFSSGQPQVFFTLDEIEQMLQSQASLLTPQLLPDLLRMMGELTRTNGFEHTGDQGMLSSRFLAAALVATGADRGVIALRDNGEEGLRLAAILPSDKDIAVNRVVLRAVLKGQEAVLCNDTATDERFQKNETVQKEHIGSMIACPLLPGEEASRGLIYCDVIDKNNAFRREHLLVLHFIARLLGMCICRKQ